MKDTKKWNWESMPVIETARLSLDEIKYSDLDIYNEIIFDKDRNIYWGYDDMLSIDGEPEYDSFYKVARMDFDAHEAINFAVRKDGKMIGEAVLFDFRKEGDIDVAELGCRILRSESGYGYGAEAFYGVLHWALESGLVSKVVAKCFHENTPSYFMLSREMKQIGEDKTFKYFELQK